MWNELEWAQYEALTDQWLQEPPVAAMVAAWIEYEPPAKATAPGELKLMNAGAPPAMAALRAQFPGGVMRMGPHGLTG